MKRYPALHANNRYIFSKEGSFVRANASQVTTVAEFLSNHEEADNNLIFHSAHAIKVTLKVQSFYGPFLVRLTL